MRHPKHNSKTMTHGSTQVNFRSAIVNDVCGYDGYGGRGEVGGCDANGVGVDISEVSGGVGGENERAVGCDVGSDVGSILGSTEGRRGNNVGSGVGSNAGSGVGSAIVI